VASVDANRADTRHPLKKTITTGGAMTKQHKPYQNTKTTQRKTVQGRKKQTTRQTTTRAGQEKEDKTKTKTKTKTKEKDKEKDMENTKT
jgi:hypothetical protein